MSDALVYWLPLGILIVVWIYFIRAMKRKGNPFAGLEKSIAELQQQNTEIMKQLSELKSAMEDRKT